MSKAQFIKSLPGFNGDARLYQLDAPMKYEKYNDEKEEYISLETNFIVVSATCVPFSGDETYIFPSDENGNILDWSELDGSFRGSKNHELALQNAGYIVKIT